MVFSILFEITSPVRSLRWPRSTLFSVSAIQLLRLFAQRGDPGFKPGNVPAQGAKPGRFFQLAAGLLESQIENLLPQVAAFGLQFRQGQIFYFVFLHCRSALLSPSSDGK